MRSTLLSLVAWPSAAVCVATCALWILSYQSADAIGRISGSGSYAVTNQRGRLNFYHHADLPGRGWTYVRYRIDIVFSGAIASDWPVYHAPGLGVKFGSNRGEWFAIIPHALVVAATAGAPVIWFIIRLRRRGRRAVGSCLKCGYDLRATPGRCPECGTPAMNPRGAGASRA